ncbi:MAG: hypothetical protein R3E87_15000 [Burkholderiaceae bacterium]
MQITTIPTRFLDAHPLAAAIVIGAPLLYIIDFLHRSLSALQ